MPAEELGSAITGSLMEIRSKAATIGAVVRIDGPRGGVNWVFFKFLKQLKQP